MRLEQLRYLLGVQETGSIAKTAEKYFISSQAVSKAIKALENEWQVVLLQRGAKKVVLTDAGVFACEFAKKTLAEYEQFYKNLRQYTDKDEKNQGEKLVIYSIPRYITPQFLRTVELFGENIADLKIELRNATVQQMLNEKILKKADIGLLSFYQRIPPEIEELLEKKKLQWRVLKKVKFGVCVHEKMPLASYDRVSEQDLRAYQYVSFRNDYYDEMLEVSEDYSANYQIDNFEQHKVLLKQGNCFSRCTEREFKQHFKKEYKLLEQTDAEWNIFVAFYKKEKQELAECFLEKIEKHI